MGVRGLWIHLQRSGTLGWGKREREGPSDSARGILLVLDGNLFIAT